MKVPLILGENVYYINPRTFYNAGITSVTFTVPFMEILQEAFCNCKNLTSLTIPKPEIMIGFYSQSLYIGSEENKATITFNGGTVEFF